MEYLPTRGVLAWRVSYSMLGILCLLLESQISVREAELQCRTYLALRHLSCLQSLELSHLLGMYVHHVGTHLHAAGHVPAHLLCHHGLLLSLDLDRL